MPVKGATNIRVAPAIKTIIYQSQLMMHRPPWCYLLSPAVPVTMASFSDPPANGFGVNLTAAG